LALFTGARLEELAQLRVGDIVEVPLDGGEHPEERRAWAIDINAGPDGKNRLKNKRAIRQIPIHPSLLELGLLSYVRTIDDPLSFLFPKLTPNGDERYGAKWGEWFSSYRKSLGLSGRDKVFHSFRHTFKDVCGASKIPDKIQRQLMGHAPIDVADSYGVGFSFTDIAEALATYRVARLVLPARPHGLDGSLFS
jgi:integrase